MHLWLKYSILFSLLAVAIATEAQRVIEYEAGMGTRDAENPAVWILYNQVRATHDGMVLYADSAWLNTEKNDFTAFGNVKIDITDTTTIFGDQLYYDGEQRLLDIWDDTVVLIDGSTILRTPQLSYNRNTSTAYYSVWGHTESGGNTLESREGYYNSDTKILDIYRQVALWDTSSRLETDTLIYNTQTKIARFMSPTYIYSKSATLYSERGMYHTDSNYAVSTRASRIEADERVLTCDILHYWDTAKYGEAYGHVCITDTANHVICTGDYGETDQQARSSFVTSEALVRMEQDGDTLYIHADTIFVYNDTSNELQAVQAYHKVKLFRSDVQGMCDSVYYHVPDSLMRLFGEPVLWYDNYQCTSDSIDVHHDSTGVRRADINGHSMVVQQVDAEKFNQLKGKRTVVYFIESEPTYADILGNAQMVYYVTETDSLGRESLIGANAGVGADMRIYFHERQPQRVVTFGNPDMNTYPVDQLPPEMFRLADFKWLASRRPRTPKEIFVW
ncbi:MAG: hypothetical protein II793_01335 [Bacteroidales bacterium]|nr:hypothetical protein [Bacteroidales bacterium]